MMATADRDGTIAQVLGDMHTCLVMSINESLRDAQTDLDRALARIPADDELREWIRAGFDEEPAE